MFTFCPSPSSRSPSSLCAFHGPYPAYAYAFVSRWDSKPSRPGVALCWDRRLRFRLTGKWALHLQPTFLKQKIGN